MGRPAGAQKTSRLSRREALLILLARCLLGALVGGNLTALAFSLTGGALALGVMAAAVRLGAELAGSTPQPNGAPT